jgi:predicted ribosomally synthesized peptide with nif11-like leader
VSEEQLKAFLEKVKGDTSLQEKLKAAADANAVAAIAKKAGFSISTDDLKNAQPAELSETDLEAVTGGIPTLGILLGGHCKPDLNTETPGL